jgi:hypothetical protein
VGSCVGERSTPALRLDLLERLGWTTIQRSIRDARFYAIDANSLFPSPSESVWTCFGSCLWLIVLQSLYYLPRRFLSYLDCSDLLLIRRGATRWGNLGPSALFAEATSCQLEYKYLAKVTGRAEYYEKVRFPFSFRIPSIMDACMQVERIMDVFYAANTTDGLFANRWFDNGTPLGGTLLFFFSTFIPTNESSPFHCWRDRR